MDIIDSIKSRRSIRKYQNKQIPDQIIKEIIDCACHAPSTDNTQPWHFIVVKNKIIKTKLSNLHPYAGFIKNAPVVIAAGFNIKICPDKFMASLSTATAVENMLLAIHNLGLGACWVYLKDPDEPEIERNAKKILKVKNDIELICLVPIGYPAEKPVKKKINKLNINIIQ